MPDLEVYGGQCPNCTHPLFQKYNRNLNGLMFDACLSCGFCNGEVNREFKKSPQENSEYLWNIILNYYLDENVKINKKNFQERLDSLKRKMNNETLDNSFFPTIFKLEFKPKEYLPF